MAKIAGISNRAVTWVLPSSFSREGYLQWIWGTNITNLTLHRNHNKGAPETRRGGDKFLS